MTDVYCSCKDKKKIKNTAGDKSFEICSKNLGGCGKEIKEEKKRSPLDLYQTNDKRFIEDDFGNFYVTDGWDWEGGDVS